MRYAVACGLLILGTLLWAYASGGPFAQRYSDEQVAYARVLAEKSPLVALAGTEPGKLRGAIDYLERVQRILADSQDDEHSAEYVRNALYPLRFLRALADLEEKRHIFVGSGSEEDLHAYDNAMDAAISAYRADIRQFRIAFENIVPKEVPEYVAGNAVITRSAVLDTLDTLERGIAKTKQLHDARQVCIRRGADDCGSMTVPESSPNDFSVKISAEERARAESIRALYAAADSSVAMTPLLEMQKGVCTETLPGSGIFALFDYDKSLKPVYLGDLRLTRPGEHVSVPFYAYFAEHGVEYAPVSPLTPYSCPEFADEFSRLLGMRTQQTADVGALEALVQQTNNSANFNEIVRFIGYVEEAVMHSAERGAGGTFDAVTLFYVRSSFLALFLAHNPSVAGDLQPFFPSASIPIEDQPFVFYSSLPPSARSSVIEGIRAFDEVHRPLP